MPRVIWTTADKRKIPLRKLTTPHILRITRFLIKAAKTPIYIEDYECDNSFQGRDVPEWLTKFNRELKRRRTKDPNWELIQGNH